MNSQATPGATLSPPIGGTKRCTRAWVGTALAVGVLLAVLSVTAPGARGAFEPIGLRVDGGEESWQAERLFTLRWSNPPGVAAVHYRLLDPAGEEAIADTRVPWATTKLESLHVAPDPGAYLAEVWLEDGGGATGPPARSAPRTRRAWWRSSRARPRSSSAAAR